MGSNGSVGDMRRRKVINVRSVTGRRNIFDRAMEVTSERSCQGDIHAAECAVRG